MFKSKLFRFAWRVTQFVIVLYLGLLIYLFFAQRQLIYHPAHYPMDIMRHNAQGYGFEAWLNSSGQFIGWKQLSKVKREHGRLLIVHGNSGCAVERIDYADGLQLVEPMDIYILEYPGFGARDEAPTQASLFAAASEGLQLLKGDAPIYIMGESLGTGVAAYLAGTYPDMIRGVVLIAPYANLTEVAQSHMPFFVPVSLMLRDRFPSATYLKNYHGPVAMRFAGQDEVVPNRFGHKLYDDYQGPKKFWEVPAAGHNDLMNQKDWWRDTANFWKTNASAVP